MLEEKKRDKKKEAKRSIQNLNNSEGNLKTAEQKLRSPTFKLARVILREKTSSLAECQAWYKKRNGVAGGMPPEADLTV